MNSSGIKGILRVRVRVKETINVCIDLQAGTGNKQGNPINPGIHMEEEE